MSSAVGLLYLVGVGVLVLSAVDGATQCYGSLGCFKSEDFYHATYRPVHTVPQSRSHCNVKFYLFTRSNPGDNSYKTLTVGDESALSASTFQGDKDTKLIIHGYYDKASNPWIMKMKDALLKAGDFNVISVDWKNGADGMYDQAAANTWVVGGEIALLIKFLCDKTSATPSKFHLIGHSLGSHVSGYAGASLTSSKLGRITAMDPAGPLFQGTGASVRIDPTDADYVDAIHTDGNNIVTGILTLEGGFGMKDPVGHIDFYPNGGKGQPGCDSNFLTEIISTLTGDISYLICDHNRALQLMTDSILAACDMKSLPCKDYSDFKDGKCKTCGTTGCGIMGYKADQAKPPSGQVNVKQYLQTGSTSPFCRRHFIVTAKISSSSDDRSGYLGMKLKANNGHHTLTIEPGTLEAGKTYTSNIELVDGTLGSITELEIFFEYYVWYNPFDWGTHQVTLDYVKAEEFGSGSIWFCGNEKTLKDDHIYTLDVSTSGC